MMWCEALCLQHKLAEDHAVDVQQAVAGKCTLSNNLCFLHMTLQLIESLNVTVS